MSWFADLADKAENLLNNLDEKTGVALRNHNIINSQHGKCDPEYNEAPPWKRKTSGRSLTKNVPPFIPNAHHVPEEPNSPLIISSPVPDSPLKTLTGVYNSKPTKQKKSLRGSKTYDLNRSPRTVVEELKLNDVAAPEARLKNRKLSLPDYLHLMDETSGLNRNVEIENIMLKGELNLMNNEVSKLLIKLRAAEQATELTKLKENILSLEENQVELKQINQDLLMRVNILDNEIDHKRKECLKYEKDLKFAQNIISELQLELTKTKEECQRLQTDWDAYKLRVKNMLIAKDQELKSLQTEPMPLKETKTFIVELEKLRSDREELIEDLSHIRNEYNVMKSCMEDLESKSHSTEKIVAALRDALREERIAKNRLEVDYAALNKEHKKHQLESSHTIAKLQEELVEKERMTDMKHPPSGVDRTSDINSLNVADYDAMQGSLAAEKIQCLTDTLVVKQRKIDSLIAENNMMRIQMEKLETKYKNDVTILKTKHSVVHVNDEVSLRERVRHRKYIPESIFSRISVTIGSFLRRHPLFRMFVIIYMVGLHLWVLFILLTYSPDGQNYKPMNDARH